MGLSETIKAGVDNAFKAVGNLATNISLSRKTSAAFDFTNLDADVSSSTTVVISGIVTEKKSKDDNRKTVVLFKSTDINNIIDFDEMTIKDVIYIPEKPFSDNGFITEITVVRRP